jgi:hypothetical protein
VLLQEKAVQAAAGTSIGISDELKYARRCNSFIKNVVVYSLFFKNKKSTPRNFSN